MESLPSELKRGLFANPGVYPAWVRFSNGNQAPQADRIGDGRGVAIKVMEVAGSRSGTQDFIMINSPRFFVRDAADYVRFQAAADRPLGFFFPGWNPFKFRLHELFAAQAITSRVVANPLNIQYYSMTPYLYGDIACKFSLRPAGPASSFVTRTTPNFLHDNLVRSLQEADAVFDLCVQRRASSAMPVEDPTIEWSEAEAPFEPVARLIIPRQSFDAPTGRRSASPFRSRRGTASTRTGRSEESIACGGWSTRRSRACVTIRTGLRGQNRPIFRPSRHRRYPRQRSPR
jgi:hypothetical protein